MWIDPVWDDADVSIRDSENFSGSSSHITVLWSALLVIYTNAGLWLKFQSWSRARLDKWFFLQLKIQWELCQNVNNTCKSKLDALA